MIYTVGDAIHFRSEDGYLWIDDESNVTLTATTSRLLAYLLDNSERVVLRDEILEHVWDAHGLRSSGHSLNKYISDLRGVCRSLGCAQEVIVTVPKQGFAIAKDLPIARSEPSLPPPLPASDIIPPAVDKRPGIPGKRRGAAVLLIAAIVACAALWWAFAGGASGKQTAALGYVDSCPVNALGAYDPAEKKQALNIVNDIVRRAEMPCRQSVYYFSAVPDALEGKKGRVYLGRCSVPHGARGKIAGCVNYYQSDYEYHQ